MIYMNTIVGSLTIMMASGLIVDFEVTEVDNEVYVRVWSSDGRARQHLQKQIAAILPPRVEEHHVTVMNEV